MFTLPYRRGCIGTWYVGSIREYVSVVVFLIIDFWQYKTFGISPKLTLEHIDWLVIQGKMDKALILRCREWTGTIVEQTRSSPLVQQVASSPKAILYGATLLWVTTCLFFQAAKFLKRPVLRRSATPDLEKPASSPFKAPQRKPGGCVPPFDALNLLMMRWWYSVGAHGFSKTCCLASSKLGCTYIETKSVPAL
jgi:hypothetical protein